MRERKRMMTMMGYPVGTTHYDDDDGDSWTSGEDDIVETRRAVRERKRVTRRLTRPGTT